MSKYGPGSRLAIIGTHPIQYYAPWFRWIAANTEIDLKVFYLWGTANESKRDPGFGRDIRWDVPLLDGYVAEFVPNISDRPGSDRFFGLHNPRLLRRIQTYAPDVTLLIGYRYLSLLKLILTPKRRRGFPMIFRGDSHRLTAGKAEHLKADTLKVKAKEWLISQVYKRFAAVLYVGHANRDYFRLHGVPNERLFFAPHAVDNERFISAASIAEKQGKELRRELGIPEGHLLILFAGKLEEKKRPLDLLEAFRRLGRDDVSLLFVGNGHLEATLREKASEMRNVFFAPFQNQTLMPRTYAACDLFVLPSFGPEESWGLTVNEALCLGKSVVVSDHVGCASDLVRPYENGLVFEARNIGALRAALDEALKNRARLRAWGEKGRQIVQDYDYPHATAGLLSAMDFVLRR